MSQVGTNLNKQVSEDGKHVLRSDEILARQVGESRNQIARYIRLTNLIPKILDMVDEGEIAFTIAVELSYLKEEEQYELLSEKLIKESKIIFLNGRPLVLVL